MQTFDSRQKSTGKATLPVLLMVTVIPLIGFACRKELPQQTDTVEPTDTAVSDTSSTGFTTDTVMTDTTITMSTDTAGTGAMTTGTSGTTSTSTSGTSFAKTPEE